MIRTKNEHKISLRTKMDRTLGGGAQFLTTNKTK
jgi:hypothetical protein